MNKKLIKKSAYVLIVNQSISDLGISTFVHTFTNVGMQIYFIIIKDILLIYENLEIKSLFENTKNFLARFCCTDNIECINICP